MLAAIIYFWRDIVRMIGAFGRGLGSAQARSDPDWRLALAVGFGSIPIGIVALAAKGLIEGPLRSLWVVAAALVLWSVVMLVAEGTATQKRGERDISITDGVIIGLVQCVALIPGVSRSGATISAGLLRGIDRVTATRMSFFLGIPALTAAGLFEGVTLFDEVSARVGWGPGMVGLAVSFVVAYISIAWLLRFVAHHSMVTFVWYRVPAGLVLAVALGVGWLSAT
jgi:undecaprenyl-diphosphatase